MAVGVVAYTTDQQESKDYIGEKASIYIHPSVGKRRAKRKTKGYYEGKKMIRQLCVIGSAITYFTFAPQINPYIEKMVGHATFFSTAMTMPYGAIQSLQDRFQGMYIENPIVETPLDSSSSVIPVPPDSSSGTDMTQPTPSSTAPPPIEEPLSPPRDTPPVIPKDYQGALVAKTITGVQGNQAFLENETVWIRNYTNLTLDEIDEVLDTPAAIHVSPNDQPQVLVYHTHTTESYEKYDTTIYDTRNSWRDTDNTNNMTMVGNVLVAELEKNGINVIHDFEQHDFPAYNGAYDRSRMTIEEYLEEYPSIQITIDVHRDGIVGADDSVTKPVVEINGKKAAQLMIIAPCDDGSVGVPEWEENLRFANDIVSTVQMNYPSLCRPVFFAYRHYNLDLTPGSLLFEVGSNGNTLEEAMYTAQLVAKPLAQVINGYI